MVKGTPAFMRKTRLLVSPGLIEIHDEKTMIQVTNPNDHSFLSKTIRNIAFFRIPTPRHAANITPMAIEHPQLVTQCPDEEPIGHKTATHSLKTEGHNSNVA